MRPGGAGPSTVLFDDFYPIASAYLNPWGLAIDPIHERAFIALSDEGPPYYGGIWSFGLDGTFQAR